MARPQVFISKDLSGNVRERPEPLNSCAGVGDLARNWLGQGRVVRARFDRRRDDLATLTLARGEGSVSYSRRLANGATCIAMQDRHENLAVLAAMHAGDGSGKRCSSKSRIARGCVEAIWAIRRCTG